MLPSSQPQMCSTPPRIFRVLMLFLLLGASLGLPMAQAKPTIDETTSHESTLPIQAPPSAALTVQFLPTSLAFVSAGGRGRKDDARFEVRGAHGTLFLTPRETVFALPTAFPPRQSVTTPAAERASPRNVMGLVRQRFVGAAAHPKVSGLEPLPGVVNEYLGNNPAD